MLMRVDHTVAGMTQRIDRCQRASESEIGT